MLQNESVMSDGVLRTSPHPCADVTLLKAKLMVPPPFPLCVDKEPDKTAVSLVVRGACGAQGGNEWHLNLRGKRVCNNNGIVLRNNCWGN